MPRHVSRRRWLGVLAGAATAGCLDATSGASGGSDDLTVAASFFVLGDLADRVAGDAATVDTLVPVGQHGHGWQPGSDVTRRATEADVFLYMGEGFQPWADDLVRNVREGDGDAAVVAARSDVDLLPAPDGDHGHGDDSHDEESGNSHEGGDGHDAENGNGHESGDHGDGPVDPHFWLDPHRAARAVETIGDGLGEAAPDLAERFDENAAAYREDLRTLDADVEDALADRGRDVVLVAGHDAFQYLGERYDFDVVALTGVSPDDEPTTEDRRRAQEVVAEHGVEHVLAPVLESDRAAESIVEDTDAEAVLPITAMPGRAPEWAEAGWGYADVMREVNLPTLRTALDAA